jgi:hypothetical protein
MTWGTSQQDGMLKVSGFRHHCRPFELRSSSNVDDADLVRATTVLWPKKVYSSDGKMNNGEASTISESATILISNVDNVRFDIHKAILVINALLILSR